jgi:hypothetical protein
VLKYGIAIVMFVFATNNAWSEIAGRVNTAHSELRCSKRLMSEERCRDKRRNAIAKGCVTSQEAALLEKHRLCPICNWVFPGIDAYLGYCPPGCFVRGTKILIRDLSDGQKKWAAVEDIAARIQEVEIFSIDSGTASGKPVLSSHPILLVSVGPESEPMVNIATALGGRLNVTANHAVMLPNGIFVVAANLTKGDSIATLDGGGAVITAIDRAQTAELVYNFFLEVESPISHTVIAEGGLVTGDQYWQDELEQ